MPVIETQTTTTRGKGKKSGSSTVKKTTRSVGTQTRKSKKSPKSGLDTMDAIVASNHWRMLRDPCHATLGESAYPGRAGITARFTAITTHTGTTETGFLGLYAPAPLANSFALVAASNSGISPVYGGAMPGQTWMTTNAEAFRVIGCCLTIEYLGTELNRSGCLYGGILPSSTIAAGAATSIDQVKLLLSSEIRTPDRKLELVWFPGYADREYHKATDGLFEDTHNVLVLAAEGMPAGVQLKIRQTVVVEWLPKIATGMTMPSAVAGSNPPAFYEALHKRGAQEGVFADAFRAAGNAAHARVNQYAAYAGQRLVDASVGVGMASAYRYNQRRAIRG